MKGLLLGMALTLILLSVAVARWGVNVPVIASCLGFGLLMEGTALIANWLAEDERRERAEIHHGQARK